MKIEINSQLFSKLKWILTMVFLLQLTISYGQRTINVRELGAKGDGATDDATAINSAISSLSKSGGGVVYLPKGVYNLRKTTGPNHCLIVPKSNIIFKGDGIGVTILHVANSVNVESDGFNVIYPATSAKSEWISDFKVLNLSIDVNGANNLSPNIKKTKNAAIGIRYGRNIEIANVRVINNPGRQCIAIGGFEDELVGSVKITNCEFSNNADVVTGNQMQNDHSVIYIVAKDFSILNNTIDNSRFSAATTAIEIHGESGMIRNNKINNVHKAFNVISYANTCKNISCTKNSATNIEIAVATLVSKDLSLENIVFDSNSFSFLKSNKIALFDITTNVNKLSRGSSITLTNNTISAPSSNLASDLKDRFVFMVSNPSAVTITNNKINAAQRVLGLFTNTNPAARVNISANEMIGLKPKSANKNYIKKPTIKLQREAESSTIIL